MRFEGAVLMFQLARMLSTVALGTVSPSASTTGRSSSLKPSAARISVARSLPASIHVNGCAALVKKSRSRASSSPSKRPTTVTSGRSGLMTRF